MQDDTLFAGSLLENISFFDGCPSIDRVVECAQIACIHEEITRMPMGYETLIGDMGELCRAASGSASYSPERFIAIQES